MDGFANNEAIEVLTFATYNVGLLSFKLFGVVEVFANPPYAIERFPKILEYLDKEISSSDVSMICIQECYSEFHANAIIQLLKDRLPYHARHFNSPLLHSVSLKFHNGLLTLSKYPITNSYILPLHKVSTVERWLANKSHLICTVQVPSVGDLLVIHVHTTAGGAVNPEHPDVDGDREDELLQAWKVCEEFTSPRMALIIGDFNCGPEASAGNYEYILQKGFRDTFLEYHTTGERKLLSGEMCTWDPKNFLNTIGPHAHCPGQRCDHILLHSANTPKAWKVTNAKLLFQDAVVVLPGKDLLCTLSDHYGMLVQLTKQQEEPQT